MGSMRQSSIRLHGLTHGREILCLAQAGLHSIHKNRGKSACTVSIPPRVCYKQFQKFWDQLLLQTFLKDYHAPSSHPLLKHCMFEPITGATCGLPPRALLCSKDEDSDSPAAVRAALGSCGCTEQAWAAWVSVLHLPLPLHVEWEGQTPYMLYKSGIKHGLLSTRGKF